MDPLVIVFGVGVGILVGLTGIGGGSLMTPLLLIFIGTQPHVAVGTDIAYGALTAKVAVARQILTVCYYGLRDGEIRCLASRAKARPSRPPAVNA